MMGVCLMCVYVCVMGVCDGCVCVCDGCVMDAKFLHLTQMW